MAQPTIRVAPTIRTAGSTVVFLRKFFFFSFMFIAFVIIFSNAIAEGIRQGSIDPVISELGSRFFLASQQLEKASQDIIDKGGIYDPEGGAFNNLWEFTKTFSDLFVALFIIYVWIKVLSFIYGKSFLSNESQFFINAFLGFLTFLVLEMMFIVITAAVNKEIGSYNDVLYLSSLPIRSFITFFRALPYVLSPIADRIGEHYEKITPINDTVNNASQI